MHYSSQSNSYQTLVELRGIAKEVFRELGGGEIFIRNERAAFVGDSGEHRDPKLHSEG